MSDRRSKSYQRIFAELKRRHVFRVMAVYGIVGFIILQVAELAVPALLLPEWTYRFVAFLLLLGFPIALIITWAFEITPDGVRRTEAADPAQIEALVAEPASRRWPAGLLALLGGALLLYGGWWAGRRSAPDSTVTGEVGSDAAELRLSMADAEQDDRPTIAVLPFADMSPEGDHEYFSDGITEQILNTLAKIHELKVIGRTSAFAFKGENLDLRAIGDSLSASYLVEGSVRRAGDQLRITAQLIDAEDGSHLWSEEYDRELENVFEIQTEIAQAVAEALRVPLGLDEEDRLVSPTQDLEAFDLYLAGRARLRERGENVMEAIDLFEAAIARDSSWAPAWAGLAESRSLVPYYAPTSADSALWANSLTAAERAANRALDLDPDNASALVALGNVHRDRWEWEQAEAAFVRALSLDPENVEAHQQYAEYLGSVGRFDDAYAAARRALSLDRTPIKLNVVGMLAAFNRRYEEAVERLSEGIRMDPEENVPYLRSNLRRVHLFAEEWPQYRTHLRRALSDDPELLEAMFDAWPGDGPPTPEFAALATEASHRRGAMIWMALGEHERALEALDVYRDANPFGTSAWLFAPNFDPLRDDPQFQTILAARGLEGRRPHRLEPGEAP